MLQEEMHGRAVTSGSLPFKAKAVYYYWNLVSREEWRFAADPLESAQKLVEVNAETEHIALLDVKAEPGTECLAFYVTDFVESWAEHAQELAMDSTCACAQFKINHILIYIYSIREHKRWELRVICGRRGCKRLWHSARISVPSHNQRGGIGG